MKKKILSSVILNMVLLFMLIYTVNISNIPQELVLFQGEEYVYNTIIGIDFFEEGVSHTETKEASSSLNKKLINTDAIGRTDIDINIFGIVKVKEVSVSVIPKTTVIPCGSSIGIKLRTDGVLVIGKSSVEGYDNKLYKPYEGSDIKEGDLIIEINNNKIVTVQDLTDMINKSEGKDISIKYNRDDSIYTTSIEPIKASDDKYKIGLWVREGNAGVGTLTFYHPESKTFAALGHGILDVDTEKLLKISTGDLLKSNVIYISKGKRGEPGELKGTITGQPIIGTINKNSTFGVYGTLTDTSAINLNRENEIEVALRNEIREGSAKIWCSVDDSGIKEYNVEIKKIFKNSDETNKNMIIKVTDDELIDKTGGIIQGMSGSPIVQNGKFIGAVTHVMINDPTVGYAVFADIMIKNML